MMTSSRRAVAGVGAVLFLGASAVGGVATSASAEKPEKVSFDDRYTLEDEDICGFPITIDVRQTGFAITSDDGLRTMVHITERDVFRANGNALPSAPFRFNIHITRDASGDVVHAYSTGQVIVVPLENGLAFRAAGRFDFVTATGGDYVVVPESGTSRNRDAFCAALAA